MQYTTFWVFRIHMYVYVLFLQICTKGSLQPLTGSYTILQIQILQVHTLFYIACSEITKQLQYQMTLVA